MSDLDGITGQGRKRIDRAEATAEPIAADTSRSTEGRIAKVKAADEATKAEFAQLEARCVLLASRRRRRLRARRSRACAARPALGGASTRRVSPASPTYLTHIWSSRVK